MSDAPRSDCPARATLPLQLLAIALAAFAIGTSGFVIVGMLPSVIESPIATTVSGGWVEATHSSETKARVVKVL